MEIPNLVRQSLGGEEIEAGVNLGDEDLVCLTPTRTLLYRAEGLLSDEKVEEYPHEIERLDVKEGRRKTKFVVEYVDGTRSFSVPANRDQQALELFMTGVLRGAEVAEADESVVGAFRFSELALFVTEARVVKHIGSSVWSDDHEVYDFDALTGLEFERASVATEVVLEVDGRPQRIKTPNDRARKVQQVVENAVFDYYGVDSLDALNDRIGADDDAGTAQADPGGTDAGGDDIDLGGGIDPLTTGEDDGSDAQTGGTTTDETTTVTTGSDAASDSDQGGNGRAGSRSTGTSATTRSTASPDASAAESVDAAEIAAMREQLDELTAAVDEQHELIRKQQQTIEKLIEELRKGR
jgi:hypothetical protein